MKVKIQPEREREINAKTKGGEETQTGGETKNNNSKKKTAWEKAHMNWFDVREREKEPL